MMPPPWAQWLWDLRACYRGKPRNERPEFWRQHAKNGRRELIPDGCACDRCFDRWHGVVNDDGSNVIHRKEID